MAAPRPAAGPTQAFLKLLLGSANATFSGRPLLGVLDPADELIAAQRRDVHPGSERRRVGDQRFAQVFGEFVHYSTGHLLAAHATRLAGILAARGGLWSHRRERAATMALRTSNSDGWASKPLRAK
jgi:hypothetical protein